MSTRAPYNVLSRILLKWIVLYLSSMPIPGKADESGAYPSYENLPAPELETRYGWLRGTFYRTKNNRNVYAFLSVPYAQPPIGHLRFEPPQPPLPWDGFLNATQEMPLCKQLSHLKMVQGEDNIIEGDEDCLYMNIYTPRIYSTDENQPFPPDEPFEADKPVVVFIHGGGFSHGSGRDYKPKYILDNMDVVFVSINYRLGPFGFLSTESSVVPGNMGLKDQVQALAWIRDNIYLFGGDKEQVTLLGVSAGAASVHFHYLSSRSRDLFSRGISLSGSALCPWALMERGGDKYRKLSLSLGCSSDDDNERITCLKKMGSDDILRETKTLFMMWLYNPFSPFAPIVEKELSSESFLHENPYDVIRKGEAKDAPWLASVSSKAGLYPAAHFILNETLIEELQTDWNKLAPHVLDYNYTVKSKFHDVVSKTIYDQYYIFLNPPGISDNVVNFASLIVTILSDRLYNAYTAMAAKMHSYHYLSDVHFYEFDYEGNDSYTENYAKERRKLGAAPEDELIYMFGSPIHEFDKSSQDYNLLAFMLEIWRGVFLFSRPLLPNFANWDPVDKDNKFGSLDVLRIRSDRDQAMERFEDYGRQHFWMTLNIDETLFLKEWRYHSSSSED